MFKDERPSIESILALSGLRSRLARIAHRRSLDAARDESTTTDLQNTLIDIGRRWDLGLLIIILVIALAVRLLGINYGLPYVYYPDEAVIVNHAVAFGTGDLNPHYFIYPSLYMYVLSFVYGLSYAIGRLIGEFSSTSDLVRLLFNDVTFFYLPGRLIAALSGVMTVAVVYICGRRAYSGRVGLVAAVFLTFSVMHVAFSHYVKTHVPAGLLVMVALLMAWSVYQGKNSWRHYLLTGFVTGLAASTVYHAGFVLVSLLVAHVLRWRDFSRYESETHLVSLKILSAIAVSLLAFLLCTPFAIVDWPTFIGDLSSTANTFQQGVIWEQNAFFPFTSLIKGMGSPLGFLALLSLGYALFRHRPSDLILLSQPLFLAGFLMLFRTKEPHHMLIAFPPVSILCASLVVDAVRWFGRSRALQPLLLMLVTILVVAAPARISFQNSYRLAMPDTRTLAKDWVEKNIAPDSKIVMDSGKYYLSTFGPQLPLSRWTLEQFIARGESQSRNSLAARDGTRRVGYSGEAVYFRQQLQTLDRQQAGYDIIQILHDGGSPRPDVLTLEEYVALGVEYAIVNSSASNAYAAGSEGATRYPSKAAKYLDFYQALEAHTHLLKEFSPSDQTPGPTLRVYKIR